MNKNKTVMTQKTKKILIGSAAIVALVVLFNLLPASVCIAATISAGVGGATAGNTVRFEKIMFTKGNSPCPSWFPSYNDIKALAQSE